MNATADTIQDHQIREFLGTLHASTARIALGAQDHLTRQSARTVIALAWSAKHPAAHGERCVCGVYHYSCSVCATDCTVGSPDGPAHQDTRDITRCRECSRAWERKVAAFTAWTPAELAVLKRALLHVAGDEVLLDGHEHPPITAEDRRIALEILGRAENSHG